MDFSKSKILKIIKKTPTTTHIELEIDDTLKKTHTIAGQYVVIQIPKFKDGYFALSNAPSKNWSLLIKKSDGIANQLLQMNKGDELTISTAQGKGYLIKNFRQKNVLLFAVGSAISPIRSALLWFIENRNDFKNITLFYGALNPEEFAYDDEFENWKKNNIRIIPTIAPNPFPDWKGKVGFVQDQLETDYLDNTTVACVCGMPAMIEATSQKLIKLGLPKENILVNY